MEKIFHVFVSSTYSDLLEERRKVSEAVAKAGFVPEGMEIFPASSQQQMSFIKRVIDRCDYYILILAGRYGSLADDGISYTEKEFRYAKSKGIPVLAFIIKDIDNLPAKKRESETDKDQKLTTFVNLIKNDTLLDFWTNPDELATKALAALSQERVTHEGAGWIRGNTAASTEILTEINVLRKENSDLRSQIEKFESGIDFGEINLAGLDENYCIQFKISNGVYTSTKKVLLRWREIIAAIGLEYRTPSNTSGIDKSFLPNILKKKAEVSLDNSVTISMEDKDRILMQMEALGMMHAATFSLRNGGSAVFHTLTQKGLKTMLHENVVKSSN